jgi:hypothetical protein
VRVKIEIPVAVLLISSPPCLSRRIFLSAKPCDFNEAYEIYSVLLPHEEPYEFGKGISHSGGQCFPLARLRMLRSEISQQV